MAQADFTRISSNVAALNSLNSLRNINTKLGVAQLRLATGKRINQASDDPAGLTIALKMKARNESLKVAIGNIGDAKNMLAVAESGLQQISDILTEMRSKATAAASDTLGDEERDSIQNQLQSLARQINDIVDQTSWNNTSLLDGTINKVLQTGAGSSDTTAWVLSQDHDAVQLGVASGSVTAAILAAASTASIGGSFATSSTRTTGVESLGAFDGLTELQTGTYRFKVVDKADGASTGYAGMLNTLSGVGTLRGDSAATSTHELASGYYTLTIDAANTTAIDYTIRDSLGNITATYDNLDVTTATANALLSTEGYSLGITIGAHVASLTAGQQLNFEYIAEGEVKMELYKIAGSNEELVSVDANGSDDTGVDTRKSYFYVNGSSATAGVRSYNTGVGFKVYMDTWGNIVEGNTSEFDYTAAGDVSVDVSTHSLASAYMDFVDAAMTKVSESLNSIGSLVSRLDSKEGSVGSAQVNTEAAYNRIMNADMAYEQVEASKYMILQQTAIAMLAQSNTAPQGILSLFR